VLNPSPQKTDPLRIKEAKSFASSPLKPKSQTRKQKLQGKLQRTQRDLKVQRESLKASLKPFAL
jgi:hypothetical protein